jgi:NADH-quinone oxidoreductase subunit E
MSGRHLAKEQPDRFAFSKEGEKQAKTWIAKYPKGKERSAVIPLLWIAQKDNGGWLSKPAMRVVGERLGMAPIRVMEVATFYTMFKLSPVGTHLVQVCGTTPCMLRGSGEIIKVCKKRIGEKGAISADGKFTWEEVECLGACVNAPMVQVSNTDGDHYYEDLDEASMEKLLDDLAAGRAVKAGPQNERYTSEPLGGAQTLSDKALYNGSRAKPLKSIPNAPKAAKKPAPKKAAPKKTAAKAKKGADK